MKIWLDNINPAPEGYIWLKTTDEAKTFLLACERQYADLFTATKHYDTSLLARFWEIGDGNYIDFLEWLERTKRINHTFRFHNTNPMDTENMRLIIERNGWMEVK